MPQMKSRLELLEAAYGVAAVERDFEEWCEEVKDRNPRYPVSEYLKVVDSRLGTVPKEEENDPRIEELSALTFKLTHRPAPPKYVRELLTKYTLAEIRSALIEYTDGIEERELAYAARAFFVEGGCGAIIMALKNRERDRREQVARDAEEKNLIAGLVEKEKLKSDEEDRQREERNARPTPTAEEMFGTVKPE